MTNEVAASIRLWDILDEVEDPRDPSGKRYPLGNILRLMFSGFMCGCNNTAEVLRWGQMLSKANREALGFAQRFPCHAALSNLFREMKVSVLEKVLKKWTLKAGTDAGPLLHLAMDGKSLRGSAHNEHPAVHLLSLFATALQSTIGQRKQADGDNEITTALDLLQTTELKGFVVSGDAIFAQKKYMPDN